MRGEDNTQPDGLSSEQLRRLVAAEASDGLALSMDLRNNPICSVSFNESIPCITVVWKRYATSMQLRFVYEAIIQMLRTHRVNKILRDDTALPTIHTEDQQWIVQNWMPRAVRAGLRVVANKISESYFGQMSTGRIHTLAPAALTLRSFDDVEQARQWLLSFHD